MPCCSSVLKRATSFVVPVLLLTAMMPGASEAAKDVTEYTIYQGDPGFIPPFPPWDNTQDGSTPAGFSYEIIKAVCDANEAMECTVEVRPYGDCLTFDAEAPFGVGVGRALLKEDVVGCITWARTRARVRRGLAFPTVFSSTAGSGTDSTLYSSDGAGDPETAGTLHFTAGFAADAVCVEDELGLEYATASAGVSSQDAVNAAIANGDDIVLFDADVVDKSGLTAIDTLTCGGRGYSVVTYPPANLEETNRFHDDFNCGLRLIAANGTYDAICDSYDGGDRTQRPFCLAADEFDEPSKECKQKEDKSQGKAKGKNRNW